MTTSISRRTAEVPIFQGEDVGIIEERLAAFNRAEATRSLGGRLNDPSPAKEAADAYDAAVADALPRAVIAKVQSVGRKTYRRLLSEHPPRPDNEGDESLGFNEDSFLDALLEHLDGDTGETTIIAPEFKSKNALVEWLDALPDGVFGQLGAAALRVNQGGSPDPKASLASQAAQMYAAISQ